jgi:STE24 endopeptidase
MLLIMRLAERWAPAEAGLGGGDGARATALAVPVVLLAAGVVSFGGQIASNSLSRAVERSADAYALNLDRDPAAFIAVERRLAVDNVGEPDPPRWYHALFGTHPRTIDRIGAALTWSREQR